MHVDPAFVRQWFRAGLALLYPRRCTVCRTELDPDGPSPAVCEPCAAELISPDLACPRCALALPEGFSPRDSGCPRCRARPPKFDAAVRLGHYDGVLAKAIVRLKRPRDPELAALLVDLFVRVCAPRLAAETIDLVVPVPNHWRRRFVHGNGLPQRAAAAIALRLGAAYAPSAAVRVKSTLHQTALTPAERARNVRDAFEIPRPLTGSTVLLVDDVLTSGATCNELARVCRRAGAVRVLVAAVARTED